MNPSTLLELTLRGSAVFALTGGLDRLFANRIQARSRRVWWLIAAVAFLAPFRLSWLPSFSNSSVAAPAIESAAQLLAWPQLGAAVVARREIVWPVLTLVWLCGAVTVLGVVLYQTLRTSRRWSRERLCTDPALTELLEDCKGAAGVTAPIGLVLAESAASPALLGWLRPRIILPATLCHELTRTQLRAVLLHELAHFRALDVPLHWLFVLARAIHWFNPLVYLAARQWLHHRELAADEAALRWMETHERGEYGEALISALKHAHIFPAPYGALALGESIRNLKQRIVMLTRHSSLVRARGLAFALSCVLLGAAFLQTSNASQTDDVKTAATTAMEPWLKAIDTGHYEASWKTASTLFKEAITSPAWQDALKQVRTPLGKLNHRKFVSALHQTSIPQPNGELLKGEFVVAQFSASYENLASAVETVAFAKESDGTWRAAGYFIRPN